MVQGLILGQMRGGPTVAADPPLSATMGGSLFGVKVEVDERGSMRLEMRKNGSLVVMLESGMDVAAVSFGLRYDQALGRPVVLAGELADGAVLTVNDTVTGELTILIDSAGPLGNFNKSVRLVSIGFEKHAAGRTWTSAFHSVSLSDVLGNDVAVYKFGDERTTPSALKNRAATPRSGTKDVPVLRILPAAV